MAIIVFLLMDEVFAWKSPAGFEGAVSRVSRDFASFEMFFPPLFFFLVQFSFFGVGNIV